MDSWTNHAKKILDGSPTGAMPLTRLLAALAEAGVPTRGREEWILRRLADQSESFRVIPERLGPWIAPRGDKGPQGRTPRKQGRESRPWVLACETLEPACGGRDRTLARIRESIQAWGRGLDVESQPSVTSWIGAVLEVERAFGEDLRRRMRKG